MTARSARAWSSPSTLTAVLALASLALGQAADVPGTPPAEEQAQASESARQETPRAEPPKGESSAPAGEPLAGDDAQASPVEGGEPEALAAPPADPGASEALEAFAARLLGEAGDVVRVEPEEGPPTLLTVGVVAEGTVRPTFVLCGDVPTHRALVQALALGEDERAIALRQLVVVHFVPLAPEVLAGSDGGPARFAYDFPVGWVPAPLRDGAGDVPLARPDSRALAALLRETPATVALVLPVNGRVPYGIGGEWSRGGPADYAWHVLGVPSFALPPDDPEEGLAVLAGRPHVVTSTVAVAPLGEGLWRVDLSLSNPGRMPTFTEPASRLRAGEGFTLRVAGARAVAVAAAEPGAPYELVEGATDERGWLLALPPLEGGEERLLRLVLEAPEGAEALVTTASAWTRATRLSVPLVP